MSRVLRYEVPVDDRWHTLTIGGDPLYVAARNADVVEFWALAETAAEVRPRAFRVYGTGHELDREARVYRGTALAASGRLVWHLFEGSGVSADATN